MSSADERIINRLQRIYEAQGAGGASFAELTGAPSDNAALSSELGGKVPTSRTVDGQALSGDVTVTGRMLDTTGAPDNGVGANGDYAFDDATKTIYGPKAAGVWPAGVVLGATPSGGVIGTANFTSAGSIGSLFFSGVISGVAYAATGRFDVAFTVSQPDTNYVAVPVAEAGSGPLFAVFSVDLKTIDGFRIYCLNAAEAEIDPPAMSLTITRLSQ